MWERELLGLYISSHPLDAYATYLEEQTQPLTQLVPEYDSRTMTVGGIVSTVRTIVTKSGTKMAFVGLEDKFGEGEIIIFPNLYEQVGAKLVQDAVVRIGGKNSARDRDGNLGSESKLIADEVVVISDKDLQEYQSTGRKLDGPKVSAAVKKERRMAYKNGGVLPPKPSKETAAKNDAKPASVVAAPPVALPAQKLYINIKNPDDHEALMALKTLCKDHPGTAEVVLVLGDAKKSAIRLPFKVDEHGALMGKLVKALGEDAVVLK